MAADLQRLGLFCPSSDLDSDLVQHLLFNYRLREPVLDENWTNRINYYFLELPRLHRVWEKLDNNVERWCFLFRNLSTFAKVPDDTQGFDDVFAIAQTGELSNNQFVGYMMSFVTEYEKTVISQYWQQEGMKKGVRLTARKLLEMGSDVEFISKATGLSVEEIASLQSNGSTD